MTHSPRHLPATLCLAFLACTLAATRGPGAPALTNQSASPAAASASTLLTNAEQVHWLTRKEAAGGRHVFIRGVVTCALPDYKAAVVQDATGGIYIGYWKISLDTPLQVGESVEVEGYTDPGQFAPLIYAVGIKRLGTSPLPAPVHPYWDQLISGALDTQFVEIEGIVTAVRPDGVTLLTHGGKIDTLIFATSGAPDGPALQPYKGAFIRLRGCLFASWDPATHQLNVNEIRMFGPSVTVVEPAPADPFAITSKRVSDLLQFDPQASALRRVKVSGLIVHHHENQFYAMDGTNGFRFIPKEPVSLKPGDFVLVVGFPTLAGPSPVLQEAIARKFATAPLPDPRPLDPDNLFRPDNDAIPVRVNALLLNLSSDRRTLELQAGLQRFVARLDGDSDAAAPQPSSQPSRQSPRHNFPPGSRLELTGVYSGTGGNRTTHTDVANFDLLVDSPADIRVLSQPPFWNLQRLLILVAALLGVLSLASIWIWLLRLKIRQRTVQLQKEMHDREKAEHQHALAQERARIARDLHDDLGSSLTEISMLATASPGLPLRQQEASERMHSIAGKSRTLVHALDEIVWAVDPDRDTLASVARYLASYAEEYLAGFNVACHVQIPNSFPDRVVPGEVRHHLFLAVKEALNNAVRHGSPTEVAFLVRLLDDHLLISINDNGTGFDTVESQNGHGLSNLRNRLEQLHGRCELQSTPGSGTTVSLQLPLPVPSNSL